MKQNFILLFIMYLLYTFSKKYFDIKEKTFYYQNQEIGIKKNKIEVFKINKNTKKILIKMLNYMHKIFIKEKIIYYIVDDILYGYHKNKKFNKYSDNINIHIIEETFDLENIRKYLKNTNYNIINYCSFYKIIDKDIELLNRNSISINIFLVEKVGEKIKLSSNTSELYWKNFSNIQKKYEYYFDDIFPLQKVRFESMFICIPNNVEKILEKSYGDKFRGFTINNINSFVEYIYTRINGIRNIPL